MIAKIAIDYTINISEIIVTFLTILFSFLIALYIIKKEFSIKRMDEKENFKRDLNLIIFNIKDLLRELDNVNDAYLALKTKLLEDNFEEVEFPIFHSFHTKRLVELKYSRILEVLNHYKINLKETTSFFRILDSIDMLSTGFEELRNDAFIIREKHIIKMQKIAEDINQIMRTDDEIILNELIANKNIIGIDKWKNFSRIFLEPKPMFEFVQAKSIITDSALTFTDVNIEQKFKTLKLLFLELCDIYNQSRSFHSNRSEYIQKHFLENIPILKTRLLEINIQFEMAVTK
ncbi:MAG: hypothetical protein KBF59_02255 [Ignavibacterium sp.]|nr:hypothetical protein [Ignavibacterium sp.]